MGIQEDLDNKREAEELAINRRIAEHLNVSTRDFIYDEANIWPMLRELFFETNQIKLIYVSAGNIVCKAGSHQGEPSAHISKAVVNTFLQYLDRREKIPLPPRRPSPKPYRKSL